MAGSPSSTSAHCASTPRSTASTRCEAPHSSRGAARAKSATAGRAGFARLREEEGPMVTRDHRGAPVTGADTKAVELYETAVCQFNCYVGDPVATVDGAIAESPDFAMAIALKAYLLLSGMERAPVGQAAELLARLHDLKLNDRERRHAAAIACLVDGAFNRASERLDDILIHDPHDIVALQM